MQLHFLLLYLFLERLQLRPRRVIRRLRIVQLLLADDARVVQFLRALERDFRVAKIRFLCGARRFLAVDRGLLLQRIDLQQQSSRRDMVTGLYKYLDNLTFHLGIDRRRMPRLEDR